MITRQDLLEAIAECQGVRSPNANTAIKLAAFFTILDHLDDEKQSSGNEIDSVPRYSFATSGVETVAIDSDSEFAQTIAGRSQAEIWPVIDELMSTLKVMNRRLYNGVIRQLSK